MSTFLEKRNPISSALHLDSICNHLGTHLSSELPKPFEITDQSLPVRNSDRNSGEFHTRKNIQRKVKVDSISDINSSKLLYNPPLLTQTFPPPLRPPSLHTTYSSQITLVGEPAISTCATKFPKLPSLFLSIITTRPSSCSPTAARVPALLTDNWRGFIPPAGEHWALYSLPVA